MLGVMGTKTIETDVERIGLSLSPKHKVKAQR